ncbi:hypothetical protein BSKO_05156 [Bryopsis sp. KO-2023]|nr:hypothetical protein BSKO_05156 [Bryopsis sp. KO-2023]
MIARSALTLQIAPTRIPRQSFLRGTPVCSRQRAREPRMCFLSTVQSILSGFTAPLINDISTNLEDPPNFTSVSRGPLPKSYRPQIAKAYPDVTSLKVEGKSVGAVFDTALSVAEVQPRWEVTYQDKPSGAIEGVATTALIGFKDDFVIRIQQGGSGPIVVDMRSKSRTGQGDFGANAARIRQYFQELKARL